MVRNYLKTAWRSLNRNKSYAVINISGLAIGIAACLLIFLIVQLETSFDNFHKKKDRIYRIVTETRKPEGISYESGVPFPTAEALHTDYPQLEVASIFKNKGQISINHAGESLKKFKEPDIYFADSQLFDVFDFDLLSGDKKKALTEPNTVLLTQDVAEKYFGTWQAAIGKRITYENKNILRVTGILNNMPVNTDLNLKIVISYATLNNTDIKENLSDWRSNFSYCYCFVVLPKNFSEERFNKNLAEFVKAHKPPDYVKVGMVAMPLLQMHYDSRIGVFSGRTFSKQLINTISLIGIFLLVIACVNFINLATAQAVNRSKEVGVRKVLGSNREQLVLQFMSETFIITFFAVALAITMAALALPYVNSLLEIKLSNSFIYDPAVLVFLGTLLAGVTFLAGFYPAMVLSGFKPIMAIKNKITVRSIGGISLRRALVVLQFCIAQVLVIGVLVIMGQMDYFKNMPLGFDKDAIINVAVPADSTSQTKKDALRNQLLQQPGIKAVSFSFASPSDNGSWSTDFKFNHSEKKTDFNANLKWADAEYFKLYNLKFLAGRPYEKSDQVREYVVNETLIKKLGITDPNMAIGKYIGLWDDKTKLAPIVGVIKDFNVTSLRKQIPPVIMSSWADVYENIDIKFDGADIKRSLSLIEKLWNNTFPQNVYEYSFLDEKVAKFYRREEQLSQLYKVFAGIAIFISCLGLFGLVSFMAIQRTKEVGIRKTLGASVGSIVYLFSKEFTQLILVAFTISAPLGYYFMNKWLQDFTFRISIGPGIFIQAITISVVIAWLTVGYKAISAALANPLNSLRSE